MKLSNIPAILNRIRTPLTLGGLAVIVLYGLYSQILNLGIFPQLEQDDTAKLINNMMGYVFWLALIAVILGGLSYLMTRSTPPKIAARPKDKTDQ